MSVQDNHVSAANGSRKRKRQSERDAEIMTRKADAETLLEVDIMILDYQTYATTNAILNHAGNSWQSNSDGFSSMIGMTDAFLTSFRSRHPTYSADAALHFRLVLLQFCVLFGGRLTPNESSLSREQLQRFEEEHQARVKRWIGRWDRVPTREYDTSPLESTPAFGEEQLAAHRAAVLRSLKQDSKLAETHYGGKDSLSLLNLLPMFMHVCALAHHAHHCANVTARTQVMTEFMLQACLEQYLSYGHPHGSDAIDEAFAWGCFAKTINDGAGLKDARGGSTNAHGAGILAPAADNDASVEGWLSDDTSRSQHQRNVSGDTFMRRDTERVQSKPVRPNGGQDADGDEIMLVDHDVVGITATKSSTNGVTHSLPGHASTTGPVGDGDPRDSQPLTEMEELIDSMFRDSATGRESERWREAKSFFLDELLADVPSAESVLVHLQGVARSYPMKSFDDTLRSFLRECTQLIEIPLLVQIERGELAGMSKSDTRTFLRQCGLSSSGHLL